MATFTLKDRISFGNKKLLLYDITDSTTGDVFTAAGMNRVESVHATNNTDSSDTFKETIGSQGSASTKNQVTFSNVTALDDGHMWVWGR